MAKADSSQNKDKKKKKMSQEQSSKALKNLKSEVKKKPVSNNMSLKLLKKIQDQLDDIVKQRKNEKELIIELKKSTKSVAEQINSVESQFSNLDLSKDLNLIKADLKKKSTEFQHNTDKLTREIFIFKDLTERVEDKIQVLENDTQPHTQKLHNLNKNQDLLSEKISQFEYELNQFSVKFVQPEQAIEGFTEQLNQLAQVVSQINKKHQEYNTQINLLQTDAGNIKISLQQVIEKEKQSDHQYESLNRKLVTVEESQQDLIAPLETHLKQLEETIQTLSRDYSTQQRSLAGDEEKLAELTTRVGQFDELLHLSQDELKQHIRMLRDADNEVHSEQFFQISHTLEQYSQQLSDVAEQSAILHSLFRELQEQQATSKEQHDKLTSKYLKQQQQLHHNENQLITAQSDLSAISKKSQSSLSNLTHELDLSHSTNQQNIKNINSQQLNQAVNLAKLGDRIKTRSQLFSIGLIATLAISALLLFSEINQDFSENEAEQTKFAQIKTEITNKTFSKINELTKQNSNIINQQLNQIRSLIKQAKENRQKDQLMNFPTLQKDWQDQHQLLQEDVLKIKTEQKTLDQSVSGLSNSISIMAEQLQQLQKPVIKKPEPSARQNQPSAKKNEPSARLKEPSTKQQKKQFTSSEHPKIKQQVDLVKVPDIKEISQPFYAIQLLGAQQQKSIEHFLKQHKLSEKSKLYQTDFEGKTWYILLYGNYSSFSQARKQVQKLPDFLLKHKPWVRKLP